MEVSYKKANHPVTSRPKCPFLVRVFYSINDENDIELFKDSNKLPVDRQISLHLWFDSTLRDLCEFIKALLPIARSKQRFKFSKVSCDSKEIWTKKEIGQVYLHKRGDKIDDKTLEDSGLRIGDYIDVSINYK